MRSDENYYSPPSAPVSDPGDIQGDPLTDFSVTGGKIQTGNPLVLPTDNCVKCGSDRDGGKVYNKKTYWSPSWIAVTVIINLLITLILQVVMRKRLDVTFYLCAECVDRRTIRIVLSSAASVATFALGGYGIATDNGLLFGGGAVAFIVALVVLLHFAAPAVRPSAYSDGIFTVKGVSEEFLDTLAHRGRDGSTGW